MNQLKICKRCVLPETKPNILLNEDEVCNICVEYEKKRKSNKISGFFETDFIRILNKHKKRGRYDCLVMCSGGKDSSSALYYIKRRYKLNPLVFTFDQGFENEDALENVRNAVEILEVDFLFFKSDSMNGMFSKVLQTNSKAVICHLCSIWYMQLTFDIAAGYDIPIIIAGWTKGQSKKQPVASRCRYNIYQPEYASMTKATREFLNNYVRSAPKYKDFPRTVEEASTRAQKRHKCIILSPHWFLQKDPEEYVETIRRELHWKPIKFSYPANSTNCYLGFISAYNSMKYYGYTHYHAEMSKLIREGLLSREEALKYLEINFDKKFLNSIAKKLNYRFD